MYELKILYFRIGGGCSRMPDAQPHAPENLETTLVSPKPRTSRVARPYCTRKLRHDLRRRIDFSAYSPSLVDQKFVE